MQVSDIFKIKEGDKVVRWGIYVSAGFKDKILEVSEVYYNADGELMFQIETSNKSDKREFSDYSHRFINEKVLLYNFFEQ